MPPEGESMSNLRASLLVVDDQALVRVCLSEVFTKHGYGVRSAPDGFSALAEIRKEIPDLIVSDLNMPGMSGFELLSVVRRRFPLIPVIAMSSAFPGQELPMGVAADAFYQKGVDPGSLTPDGRRHNALHKISSNRSAAYVGTHLDSN